jgi:hypothetical protein
VGCYTVSLDTNFDISKDHSAFKMSVFMERQHPILQDFNLKQRVYEILHNKLPVPSTICIGMSDGVMTNRHSEGFDSA